MIEGRARYRGCISRKLESDCSAIAFVPGRVDLPTLLIDQDEFVSLSLVGVDGLCGGQWMARMWGYHRNRIPIRQTDFRQDLKSMTKLCAPRK